MSKLMHPQEYTPDLPTESQTECLTEVVESKEIGYRDEFVLERILGIGGLSKDCFTLNSNTGVVAYPASTMIVLLDPKTNEQRHIENASGRDLQAVKFSDDGNYLAFGESGRNPNISIWLTKEHRKYSSFAIADCVGIKSLTFDPKNTILVVFTDSDFTIELWNFKIALRLTCISWQILPQACIISNSQLIVCGHRKISLFDLTDISIKNDTPCDVIDKRAIRLGKQASMTFTDICCGKGDKEKIIYTITNCGYLCEIKLGDIFIDRAVKLDKNLFCVKFAIGLIFVGCPKSFVKICNPYDFEVVAAVSLTQMLSVSISQKFKLTVGPDIYALVVNEKDSIVSGIYSDRNIHSWQFRYHKGTFECAAIIPDNDPYSTYSVMERDNFESTPDDDFYRAAVFHSFTSFCGNEKSNDFNSHVMTQKSYVPSFSLVMKSLKSKRPLFNNSQAIRFTPDRKDVILGTENGEIQVHEAASGRLKRVVEAHTGPITVLDIMYNDQFSLLASGGKDRMIFVLNASNDYNLVQALGDHTACIIALRLAHSCGSLTLVSAGADGLILVRRANTGTSLKFTIVSEITDVMGKPFIDPKGELLATGQKDGNIKVFKANPLFTTKPAITIQGKTGGKGNLKMVDIDPSSSFVMVTKSEGQTYIYHLLSGHLVASFCPSGNISMVKFTNDMKHLISCAKNCALLWRLPGRMSEYMRTRYEKQRYIEMESSHQIYMACIRMEEETTETEEPNNIALQDESETSAQAHSGEMLQITPLTTKNSSLESKIMDYRRESPDQMSRTPEVRSQCGNATGGYMNCSPSSVFKRLQGKLESSMNNQRDGADHMSVGTTGSYKSSCSCSTSLQESEDSSIHTNSMPPLFNIPPGLKRNTETSRLMMQGIKITSKSEHVGDEDSKSPESTTPLDLNDDVVSKLEHMMSQVIESGDTSPSDTKQNAVETGKPYLHPKGPKQYEMRHSKISPQTSPQHKHRLDKRTPSLERTLKSPKSPRGSREHSTSNSLTKGIPLPPSLKQES